MKRTIALREIREAAKDELAGKLTRLEEQLFQMKLKHAVNQLENISQIRTTRRDIARVMYVMAEHRKGTK